MKIKDEFFEKINKSYGGKVIHYEKMGMVGDELFLSSVKTFTLPMWIFHLLRKTALFLNRLADKLRTVIRRFTKENIKSNG